MLQKSLKWLFFVLGIVLFDIDARSQSLSILWQQCYGGGGDDEGFSILPSVTGYFLFGQSTSFNGDVQGNHGDLDLWLLSVDSTGNILKSLCFGGTAFDESVQMKSCPDRGYILCGSPFSTNGDVTNNHGGCDYWLIKIDSSGKFQWQKSYGGSCNDVISDLVVTTDSGFLCSGYSCSVNGDVTGNHGYNDYWIIKVDKNGNLVWEKSIGGSSQDYGICVIATKDKGLIFGGSTASTDDDVQCLHHSEIDAWVIKLDSARNVEWQRCYGGSDDESIVDIKQMFDGSYMFTGVTRSNDGDVSGNHGNLDFWVFKTDPWGNIIWQKCFGGSGDDLPLFTKKLSDGNFIIGGQTTSNDGDVTNNHSFAGYRDMWLIKISPSGKLIWEQCFGGTMDESLADAIELPGKRLLLTGESLTSNNTGDVQCSHHGPGTYDTWLIMVHDSSMDCINDNANVSDYIKTYPNPAEDFVKFTYNTKNNTYNIRIQIVDELGEVIKELVLPPMINEVTWSTSKTPAGLYYYLYYIGSIRKSGKIVLIKS